MWLCCVHRALQNGHSPVLSAQPSIGPAGVVLLFACWLLPADLLSKINKGNGIPVMRGAFLLSAFLGMVTDVVCVQILTSAARSLLSVPMVSASTKLAASGASAPLDSATTTYCSSVKVMVPGLLPGGGWEAEGAAV